MSDQSDQLLSLDTLIVRPTIAIDGARYEILSPDELSVLDSRRFGLWHQRLDALQQDRGADGEDPPELEELIASMARKVLVGVPEALFDKLSGAHRIAVVEVFTGLLLRSRMGVAGAVGTAMGQAAAAAESASPPTGAQLFRAFSASTAEPRGNGWRTRLWRWFRPTRG